MPHTEKVKIRAIHEVNPGELWLLFTSMKNEQLGEIIGINNKSAYTSALALHGLVDKMPFSNIFMTIRDFMYKSGLTIKRINLNIDNEHNCWKADTHIKHGGKEFRVDARPSDALIVYQLIDEDPEVHVNSEYLESVDELSLVGGSPVMGITLSGMGAPLFIPLPKKPVVEAQTLDVNPVLEKYANYGKKAVDFDARVEIDEQARYLFSQVEFCQLCRTQHMKEVCEEVMVLKSPKYEKLPIHIDMSQATSYFQSRIRRYKKPEYSRPDTYQFLSELLKITGYKFTGIESGYEISRGKIFPFSLQVDATIQGAEKETVEISMQDLIILYHTNRQLVNRNFRLPSSLAEKYNFEYKKEDEIRKMPDKEIEKIFSEGFFTRVKLPHDPISSMYV